jgi:hypothetical protein
VRELVIVIADLYLPADPAAVTRAPAPPGLAGLACFTRWGTREALTNGWRAWLAAWLGRADLAAIAPARIAAAVHPQLVGAQATTWLAVPVHLSAGLSRVHLAAAGLLYLKDEELARLAQDFAHAFAGSGFSLTPASPRELLLLTPGVSAVATAEPARFAGAEVNEALPRGPAAAGLRRTWTETEMWLHALPWNQARTLPVTALWPWGALGATTLPAAEVARAGPGALATDAYVRGLWHICGLTCRAPPADLGSVLGGMSGDRTVLVVEAGNLLQDSAEDFGTALGRLDARYLSPAVAALRAGRIERLRLMANDRCLTLTRRSHWQFWRRPAAGLTGLA